MSLILDALRKSEAERRRGELPALALELPPPPSRRRASRRWWWLPAIGAVVAAGAYVVLTSNDDAPTQAAAPEGPRQFVRAEPAAHPEPGTVEVVPVAVDVVAPDAAGAPAPVPSPRPMPRDPVPSAPATTAAATPDAPAAAPPAGAPILSLADLSPAERQALPPLKLSMHLWSPDPARRFAIVDGQRVGEGDRIGSAVVERIEPAGVILAADGRRIRLPLP